MLPVPIDFPAPVPAWLDATKVAYHGFVTSATARALRTEDVPMVTMAYQLFDRVTRAFDAEEYTLAKSLSTTLFQYMNHIGVGPAARQRMGIQSVEKPGSKLDAFLRGEDVGPV